MELNVDILIVGSGVAGLYCALNLDKELNVLLVSKGELSENNTYLAQGGIATARNVEDIPLHIEDTLKAGQYENDREAVACLVGESIDNINKLIELQVPFDSNKDGLSYTKEGAHCNNRIVHVKDKTGQYLWESLMNHVKKLDNVKLMEHTCLVDLIVKGNTCYGGILRKEEDQINVYAKSVVLATGGIGGIFKDSTNQRTLTGDSLALAFKHHIEVMNLEYIQFHPTGLYDNNYYGRRFLISEAVRGEGGKLLNQKGERFVDELLPRDVVTKVIREEILKSNIPYVFLDISFLPRDFIIGRFPMIYEKCVQIGIDITKDPMLVIPSQHYHMGGIKVDTDSKTSMKQLYAVGETSCTGIHGKNRLASNSLLEGLVFSKRCAQTINQNYKDIEIVKIPISLDNIDICYFQYENKQLLKKEIQRRSPDLHDELFDNR
ncbi:L-aspartate oxidase [Alkalibaculum bacchi]|uniref:L-aspartate oxidase n=1 Tax=Alkalibaculum bacchi TaxID=645887 RepID=UPI0026EE57ED|nr:L-aspartate oxidase [Alkalibaculum bacchi]